MGLTLLLVAAGAVLVALAAYAAWLWWRVASQKRERDTHNAGVLAETEADLATSLAIIADSLLTRELNLSEGAIRLKVLLDHWYSPASGQSDYPAIYRLFLLTSTMPRGEQRDTYPTREIRRLDREREMLEVSARDDILREAAALQERFGVPDGRAGLAQVRPAGSA
ncbi:DUF2489 domain-containing protein [Salinisphaera aquimarina]|uniref:DUF2489 domain-containing protein n=1 Tax=Salinisphaera aquimarina TaxID=2094031 RepID=A0ABV7EP14_9GAMM